MTDPINGPPRRCMPLADWPATDREAWLAAVEPGDLLDEGGPGARWSPQSRRKRIESYGLWLTYLASRGFLDENARPENRVRREIVAGYIRELASMAAPYTVLSRIEDLYGLVRILAPNHDWAWLRRAANRLRATAVAKRGKDLRVRPSKALYDLGVALMREAETREGLTPLGQAMQYRNGLLIAFLAARPLRRSNLAAIVIGRNLIRTEALFWLHFEASETKNRRPIDVPLPADLTLFVDQYLDHHRQVLLRRGNSPYLWISKTGAAMSGGSIYGRITALTRHAFGEAINPHLFRDCLATSVAIDDPEHVQVSAAMLGHASLKTTQRYYDQSRMLAAGRRYQREMLALRRRLCARGRGGDTKKAGQLPQIE